MSLSRCTLVPKTRLTEIVEPYPTMVEREIAEVDDATFPLASARLVGGTFRLSGTVESLGRGEYRGLRMRVLIELSVTKVLSYELDDTSGGGALIHESAEPFDGGLHLIGVIPRILTVFTTEQSQINLEESERPVAFRRWWRCGSSSQHTQ